MIFQSLQGSGLRNRHVTQQGWGPREGVRLVLFTVRIYERSLIDCPSVQIEEMGS